MSLPRDYEERVYAGVLGKIIGVYLGRPFEQWPHKDILQKLGLIQYYVHEKCNVPLIVADDDITGTFTFIRALEDYACNKNITPLQIGQTWLNYIIENKTILWWGGMGMSTEHTAFLRLKQGVHAPASGRIALNSKVVAEQIGAQIFIDGWGMVAPGQPDLAASLATRAASVSHDGEAIHGAVVIAAMEAQAFVQRDLGKLLDTGISFIPKDSTIFRLIDELRSLRSKEEDWTIGLKYIHQHYNYELFSGGCHIIPNHAVVILGLLWGDDDFQKSQMITNTAGYDTDCNAGNVGCIMGIKNGLAGLETGPDWRGPLADRLLLPTADGGACINDALTQAYKIINIGRRMIGESTVSPKQSARYHFEQPGSVQGFQAERATDAPPGILSIDNVEGHSIQGCRSLALRYRHIAPGVYARATVATFIRPDQWKMPAYSLCACPTLYPGQVIHLGLSTDHTDDRTITARLYLCHYNSMDQLTRVYGPSACLAPGTKHDLEWTVPEFDGQPIAEAGLELSSNSGASGTVYLDYLTWKGSPRCTFHKPLAGGSIWQKAWVDGMQQHAGGIDTWIQNEGRGLLITGTRDWKDYRVTAELIPHMAKAFGLALRVQGMKRYYAFLLGNGRATLIKVLDGETVLAEKPATIRPTQSYKLSLLVKGNRLRAWLDGELFFDLVDRDNPLDSGAVAIVCEEGRGRNGPVSVSPD